MLLFRESPSDRWTEPRAGTPHGKTEMFTVEDKQRSNGRRVWVYTPPKYDSAAKQPCRLLICFNGPSYVMEIPVPTILDNLLAADQIWPTVAVMIDSTDLVSWLPIWTNTFAGALHFSDPQRGAQFRRFYRAHTP